jgi:hypothetical protein
MFFQGVGDDDTPPLMSVAFTEVAIGVIVATLHQTPQHIPEGALQKAVDLSPEVARLVEGAVDIGCGFYTADDDSDTDDDEGNEREQAKIDSKRVTLEAMKTGEARKGIVRIFGLWRVGIFKRIAQNSPKKRDKCVMTILRSKYAAVESTPNGGTFFSRLLTVDLQGGDHGTALELMIAKICAKTIPAEIGHFPEWVGNIAGAISYGR